MATCDELVELIDVTSTVLEFAGARISRHSDSRSVLPLTRPETQAEASAGWRDSALSEVHVHTMLRTKEWKLVIDGSGETVQFFDLVSDPGEQRNLTGHPECELAILRARSKLLSRLAEDTFRPGEGDEGVLEHDDPRWTAEPVLEADPYKSWGDLLRGVD